MNINNQSDCEEIQLRGPTSGDPNNYVVECATINSELSESDVENNLPSRLPHGPRSQTQ